MPSRVFVSSYCNNGMSVGSQNGSLSLVRHSPAQLACYTYTLVVGEA